MALRWKISVATADQRDISANVRAMVTSVRANAEEGSVAISSLVVDDPDGTLDIPALKVIYGQETESTFPTFYRGTIADRVVSRGDTDKSFRTEAARQWTVQMADQNERLSRRVLLGIDAKRPAETDVARIQYLMSSPEMTTVGITESDYIDTTGPVAMDAADYRGQTVLSVISDCAQASGKNFWVMRRDDVSSTAFGLWYDWSGSTAYASTIAISNDPADIDGVTTFAASFDTSLSRDPSRVFSGIYLPFDGGAVYQQQSSTSSNFQARDTTAYSANVKTTAKANARAIRYLADIDTEEDRISTSIIVPNAQVNDLREGHLFYGTFTHLPGYAAPTAMRVLNRTVTQLSEEYYQLDIEASPGEEGSSSLVELAQLYGTASSSSVLIEGSVTLFGGGSITGIPPDDPTRINDGNDSIYVSSVAPVYGGLTSPRPFVPDNVFERRWTIDLGASYSVALLKLLGYSLSGLGAPDGKPDSTAYSLDGSAWTTLAQSSWLYISQVGSHRWYHMTLGTPIEMRYLRIGSRDIDPGGPTPYWGCEIHGIDTLEMWGYP